MSAEWQFKVGSKATLILDSRLCGSLRSPRAVVYSATFWNDHASNLKEIHCPRFGGLYVHTSGLDLSRLYAELLCCVMVFVHHIMFVVVVVLLLCPVHFLIVILYGIRRYLFGDGSIIEVKQLRARFIIGWVTALDCQVLYTLVGLREPRKSDGSSNWPRVGRRRTSMDVGAVSIRRDCRKSTMCDYFAQKVFAWNENSLMRLNERLSWNLNDHRPC